MPHSTSYTSNLIMTSDSAWDAAPTSADHRLSIFGSLRKLAKSGGHALHRTNSNNSQNSQHSQNSLPSPVESFRGPADLRGLEQRTPQPYHSTNVPTIRMPDNSAIRSPDGNPLTNASPPTRRPARAGFNAFTVPSNEPPPAYSPSPVSPISPAAVLPASNIPAATTSASTESPYSFLSTFDTILLIDDSGSMAGRSWREVSQALSTIAPIVTQFDQDGIDIYFLNHKSNDVGEPQNGIAPGGYRGIKRAPTVTEIFERVRPGGGTPTGVRVHNILKPYLTKLEREMAESRELKPLNLIVLTDGVPSDDVESVLLNAAKKLDKLDAAAFQIGVQFFQVGNEEGAKEALEELDDGLSALVEGGVRDIVDTVTWTGGSSSSEGGVGLTGDGILKAVSKTLSNSLPYANTDSAIL